jgi:hypothetical protein
MGIEPHGQSNQLQADRAKFFAQHKASGNGSFPSMHRAELEAGAKQGNTWAQKQLAIERRDEMKISTSEGESARLDGEAWGKTGDALRKMATATSWGAHENIRSSWDDAVGGNYTQSAKEGLKAVGKIGVGAVKTYAIDKVAGALIGKGANVLASGNKAVMRTLGEFASKNAEEIWAAPGMGHGLLHPGVEGAFSATH